MASLQCLQQMSRRCIPNMVMRRSSVHHARSNPAHTRTPRHDGTACAQTRSAEPLIRGLRSVISGLRDAYMASSGTTSSMASPLSALTLLGGHLGAALDAPAVQRRHDEGQCAARPPTKAWGACLDGSNASSQSQWGARSNRPDAPQPGCSSTDAKQAAVDDILVVQADLVPVLHTPGFSVYDGVAPEVVGAEPGPYALAAIRPSLHAVLV